MSSSSEPEYSPERSSQRKNWAVDSKNAGKYGIGPGLQNPEDPIQNSDEAYEEHMEKTANIVGSGPTMRSPSNVPQAEHFEHRDARSHAYPPPPHEYGLHTEPIFRTNAGHSIASAETTTHAERQNTISTLRTKIGLEPEAPIVDGHEVHNHLTWSFIRTTFREPFAEFFGTFIMVLFGDGSVAQVLLSAGETSAPGMNGFGNYQSINWG
jgi:aquaglyceroporin related protein